MPRITSSPLTNPNNPSTPLTGVIVLSNSSSGCGSSGACTIVTFANGAQTSAYSYSPYALSPTSLSLPISVPTGDVYYNVVVGDPVLIACDPSRLCGTMPYKNTIGASDLTWAQLVTLQPAPNTAQNVNDLSLALASVQSELQTEKNRGTLLAAQNKQLRDELAIARMPKPVATPSETSAAKPGETAKLISQLTLSTCQPPTPVVAPKWERKPSKGCCGEVDSVAGFLEKAGESGKCQ